MSPSASEVSVVTVNWNGRGHLAQLLPSLLGLGCREWILVDNGSSDGSQEFVRQRFPQVRILQNAVNRGFSQPCNLGARAARGAYVAFINNDMRADPGWLDNALPLLTREVPCVASRILNWEGDRIDFNGSSLQYLGYALQRDIDALRKEVSHEDKLLFPCGGAMIIEREVFLKIGGLDEDFFAIYEDVDLGWRLWVSGYQVAFAPDSIVYHRGHATLASQGSEKVRYLMHRNALLTILKNYEEATFRRILPLAVILAIKRAVLCSGVRKEIFYLWAPTQQRLKGGDRSVGAQLLDALNHLVAVDDVLETLPDVLEKRRRIQSMRRRSDAEILEWFVDPLRPIVEDPSYVHQEIRYLDLLGLDRLIDPSQYTKHLERLPDQLKEKIAGLRSELSGTQWLAGRALSNPPTIQTGRLSHFFSLWKREGLRAALNRILNYVQRGI